jgi:hypothetical protein
VNEAEYREAVSAVEALAVELVANASAGNPPRLGARARGTETFAAPSGLRPGLAVLRATDPERHDWYLAEVLPGGSLIRVLLRFDGSQWMSTGLLRDAGKTTVLELPDAAGESNERLAALVCFARAFGANDSQSREIRKRATTAASVFRPALELYDAWVAANPDALRTERLTDHLLGARETTTEVIARRSRAKHGQDAEAAGRSIVNSLRRSAGTNYQGLVALGLAEDLRAARSAWYVHYPPPREYMKSLALRFTPRSGFDVEIDPDIDILIKNAAWQATSGKDEPVVLLSVKTSLADRAGAAARWKMYFDVATRVCPFDGQLEGCAWHEQGLRFAKPDLKVRLEHCIVTANIYKVSSDERFLDEGELGTAQTKANTFMFDRRYATRIGVNVAMEGWEPLTAVMQLLANLSDEQDLPH